MSSAHKILRYVRLLHLYFGVFIAPALLFFAFTGALQTFNLHETTRGSSYKPPAWAVILGQIHKKQTPIVPVRRVPPPEYAATHSESPTASSNSAKSASDRPPQEAAPKSHNALPLKIFFLLVAIGLFVSTCTGLYMSYKYVRNRLLITALLVAGTVIPVVLTIW
jgi:hypothetical protein